MWRGCGWSRSSRSWGIIVTPATSISFFRPEFDDFLYASIGADRNEMSLSVLSALARLDVDPWEEAAELSELPKKTAAERLASLIAQLPGGRWTQADSSATAVRLIELLPRRSRSQGASAAKAHGFREMSGSAKMLICAALGAIALIIATSHEPSPRGDQVDAPAFNTAPPPPTPRPSSR